MFEDLITDRTLEDVQNRTAKGHYNASDLNRVEDAAKEMAEMLTKEAYPVVYKPHIRNEITEIWDENTILLLHANDFLDESQNGVVLENSNTIISNEEKKFGSGSFYFDGNSWIKFPMAAIGLDFNNEWTLEWWERQLNTGGAAICMPNDNNGFVANSMDGSNARLFAGNTGWDYIPVTVIGHYDTSNWVNRAICKSGSTVIAFENGIKTAEITVNGSLNIANDLYIGYRNTTEYSGGYVGYIDEIRISNIARYTSNFEVQNKEFIAKTKIIDEKKDWIEPEEYAGIPDYPTESEMYRYLHNIKEIKRQFYQKTTTPNLPETMNKITYRDANAIEQLIIDTNDLYKEMMLTKRKSGTFKAGEILP